MGVYIGEFVGTMILILLGGGVCANTTLKNSNGKDSGWIVITAGWGFGVAMAAYITGWISGAHLNPALTIALAVSGLIGWELVGGYIIAQMLGAMAGATLVYLAYKKHYDATENAEAIRGTFCTGPAIPDFKWNFMTEMIGTFLLVFGIRGIGAEQVGAGALGTLLVGFLVWAIGLSLGGPTGYAINPARDLGPRIAYAMLPIKNKTHANWAYAWLPVVAPIVGAVLGSVLFDIMLLAL